jgi:pentatricopeptide repeat protein
MERVFHQLENNSGLQIQGTHWASLIHAYGCVKKDLDKAIATFDNLDKHPSSARSPTPLPDAVTYEALLNVLVTHRRSDLIPTYIERLQSSNIHMTAYIANLIIKGYAAAGHLDKAREFFEKLEDPPEGIAAPNNRAPHHEGGSPLSTSFASGPVYREVSLPFSNISTVFNITPSRSHRLGRQWSVRNWAMEIGLMHSP